MAEDATTTSATTTTATEWTSAVPEAIRGHEALKGIDGIGTLASKYVELSTPKPFAETLPEDIRGEATFKDIKDLGALAKSYHNAQKMLGVPKDQLLRLPTSDKPEDWSPVYEKLGRPAKPDGYTLKLPEGVVTDPEVLKANFAKAHELGLSQKQLEGMYGHMHDQGTAIQARAKADYDGKVAASVQALKTEWGAAYDQKMAQARRGIEHYDKEAGLKGELMKALEDANLINNPGMAKIFQILGSRLGEDPGLTGKASGSEALQSPVEAQQSINALRTDQTFMKNYMNPNKRDPAHIEAVAKMEGLYKIAYPGRPGQAA